MFDIKSVFFTGNNPGIIVGINGDIKYDANVLIPFIDKIVDHNALFLSASAYFSLQSLHSVGGSNSTVVPLPSVNCKLIS